MLKKMLVLLLVFCSYTSWAEPVGAYGQGDFLLSIGAVYAPLGLGSDWGEVNMVDDTQHIRHDAKLGQPAIGGEMQVLYFVNPYVAAGLSFQDKYFGMDLASGWQNNVTTRQRSFMATGRVFLNPKGEYKFYLPLGLGFTHTDMSADFGQNEHFKYTGFAYFIGLGCEKRFSEKRSLGFELRYNGNKFHDSLFSWEGNKLRVYDQANYISTVLRFNYMI